ncbi:GTPase [Saccharibacillus brassicae]|uniref:GTP-binding protein n=1 Tax=Saccharibacillus brassicae TaxID=2583377 RepID=A0A4Y6UU93_SACBS|nr:GTPase [Saccharibacillus brassicae]QDH19585.1 GTP-binding protein [Saccharibacillus brassicae]
MKMGGTGSYTEHQKNEMKRQIREAADTAFDQEMAAINAQLKQQILIAMIGDVNAGKSSTINRIVGEEVAGVGAEPGETTAIHPHPYKDKIFFIDTPGLNDVNTENSATTLDYFRKTDVVLFFLNAAGTVFSESEQRSFRIVEKANPNILIVLNKIDAADEVDRLVARVRHETGHKYDVIPISSRTGENIDNLRDAILDLLKKNNKDILFAHTIKAKSSTANKWIIGAATSAGAIGAVPLPGADIVPITALQIGLLTRLAALYERPISREAAKEIVITAIVGNLGRTLFGQIVKMFPGAGTVAAAGVASSVTLALGYSVKYAYERGIDVTPDTVSKLYRNFRDRKNKGKKLPGEGDTAE